MPQEKPDSSLYVKGFPADLLRDLKVMCAQKGTTIREEVTRIIKRATKKFQEDQTAEK